MQVFVDKLPPTRGDEAQNQHVSLGWLGVSRFINLLFGR
jgi:hypothetical protein